MAVSSDSPGISAHAALTALQPTKAMRTNRNAWWLKIRSRRSASPAVIRANQDSSSSSPISLGTDTMPPVGRIVSTKLSVANRARPTVRFAIVMSTNPTAKVATTASLGS